MYVKTYHKVENSTTTWTVPLSVKTTVPMYQQKVIINHLKGGVGINLLPKSKMCEKSTTPKNILGHVPVWPQTALDGTVFGAVLASDGLVLAFG